jgi:hypothetical protein
VARGVVQEEADDFVVLYTEFNGHHVFYRDAVDRWWYA